MFCMVPNQKRIASFGMKEQIMTMKFKLKKADSSVGPCVPSGLPCSSFPLQLQISSFLMMI